MQSIRTPVFVNDIKDRNVNKTRTLSSEISPSDLLIIPDSKAK